MKKIFFFFLSALSSLAYSQSIESPNITESALFDQVYDRFGNSYQLADLLVTAAKPLGNVSSTGAASLFCTAGYYRLYADPASSMATNTLVQTVLCEVFSNLSGLINSTLPSSVGVNILIANTTTQVANAVGGPFYAIPAPPVQGTLSGIAENQVFKTISTGQDAWQNLPYSLYANVGPNAFFHGAILINPGVSWHLGLGSPTIQTEYDAYSVFLHEATHVLGFLSLIDVNGNSKLAPFLNFYSTYDTFLRDANGNPLIAPSNSACPYSNISYVASPTAIATTSTGCLTDNTSCSSAVVYVSPAVTATVYTPNCFEDLSSLSHFEDQCYVPSTFTAATSCFTANGNSNNNLYYVMSNANSTGTCYAKRYLKEEERYVLCDLGYSVNNTYTSNAAAAPHSYTGGACSGKNVWGLDDGFNGTYFTYTTTASSYTNFTSAAIANDATTTVQMTCLDVVYGNATAIITGGVFSVTPPTGYSGLIVLRYYPQNSASVFGNATYIYVYFLTPNCNNSTVDCNLVQNGSFEALSFGATCGNLLGSFTTFTAGVSQLGCWDRYENTGNLFTRNCTNTLAANHNLNINTLNSIPILNSYNGAPNDRIVGLQTASSTISSGGGALKNHLISPVLSGQPYRVSVLLSNYTGSLNGTPTNTANLPVVFSIASNTIFQVPNGNNFPLGLTPLVDFTVPAITNTNCLWTAFTQTFNLSTSATLNAVMIGPNTVQTFTNSGAGNRYVFVDELSIYPLTADYFTIPTASLCGYTTYTDLAQYTSTTGVFSGIGVTQNGSGQYNFNLAGTLTPGYYPISFSYTTAAGCNAVLWQNVLVTAPLIVAPAGTSTLCLNTSNTIAVSAFYSALIPGLTYSFFPGNSTGANQTFSPNSNTTYTVSVYDPINNCTITNTLAVIVQTNCCASVGTVWTTTTIPTSTTITGSNTFLNSFTVQPGQTLTFGGGEYIFAPDVKITVSPGAGIQMQNSHLYACGSNMWTGFDLLDGGVFNADPGNLIEDAKTAIRAANQFSASGVIISAVNTAFNKNYIDIAVSKHSGSPLDIRECVFTCRTLTFTSSTWPLTGNSAGDLRYAATATTGLAAPYLLNANEPLSTLKKPYLNQYSYQAISLADVGVTSGTTFVSAVIGSTAASTQYSYGFNLFDAHGNFITAINSNVMLHNNVFQNTKRYVGQQGLVTTIVGGNAINSENYYKNSLLDLGSSSFDVGNRFWDCHTSVKALNLLRFYLENAIFRSTQSITSVTYQPGNTGLQMNTNRFQYFINNNEFTNINSPISIPIAVDIFTSVATGTQTGIFADRIIINDNLFSRGTSTINYINTAVNINWVNNWPPTIAQEFGIPTPFSKAIVVESNTMSGVYRAVNMNGVTGFQSAIRANQITLNTDNTFNPNFQNAIHLSGSMSASNAAGQQIISTNTVFGSASSTIQSAFYIASNSGLHSPSITCNTATNSGQGFVFSGTNIPAPTINGTQWLGNKMGNLLRGMVLTNTGVIGPQGNGSQGIGNRWEGTWTSGTNYGTWTQSSTATSSSLFVNGSITGAFPPNNAGIPFPISYTSTGALLTTSLSSEYSCGMPSARVTGGTAGDFENDEQKYIAHTGLYRFLHLNDSIRSSDGDLQGFYDELSGSNIAALLDAEGYFYHGDYANGRTIVENITSENDVEANYLEFYRLYGNYQEDLVNGESFSEDDSTALLHLAMLCPEVAGLCVYQARALFNSIYPGNHIFSSCEEQMGLRLSHDIAALNPEENYKTLTYKIFPNPSSGVITLQGTLDRENLQVTISDLSGRTLYKEVVQIKSYFNILNLELIPGSYLLQIMNSEAKTFTIKLLISE